MNQGMETLALGLTPLARNLFAKSSGNTIGLALCLALVPAGTGKAAEPAPNARVGAYAKHVGGKIVYYYQVTNRSPLDIVAVSIGRDTRSDEDPANDIWELSELPAGWNPKLGIPAANSGSPTGWRISMTAPAEESKTHAINWEISNVKSPVIASGQTQTKMNIALDKADASYLTSHAVVTFADGPAAPKDSYVSVTVPVESLDNAPPILEVTVAPGTIWPADDRHVPVNVTFPTRTDNYDNLPQISLESVTASEPLESDDIRDASYGLDDRHLRLRARYAGNADRIYTVTYSATDASGNQTIASGTVTVPVSAPPASQN